MDPAPSSRVLQNGAASTGDRLDSWKEIAAYLKRSVRTVHRWEKDEALPVHRHQHRELGSVFAYKSELDAWFATRCSRLESRENIHRLGSRAGLGRTIASLGAAAVLCITAAFYFLLRGSDPVGGVASLELISTFPGSHRWPSFSPDGRMVAFVSDARGTPQVWVKSLAGGDPIQVTFGELPALRPRWSPQGDRIIYSVQGGGIWSVTPLAADPRRIVEQGWNGELSPDGRRLVFERRREIFIANGDGNDVIALSGLPRRVMPYMGDAWPTFSPDGKSIAVFLGEEGRYGDYWIIPTEGGEPRQLTADFEEGGAPAWTPDGKFLVFSSARRGSMNLWRVSTSGGPPEPVTTGPGDDLDPVVSPDSRTLLFANVKRTWALVAQDVSSGTRRTLIEQRTPLVFPAYSPDGRRIAYSTRNSRGDTHLFVMDADGSNQMPVTNGVGELNVRPQWSDDGKTLYFYQVRPAPTFRRISVSGGPSREVAPWSYKREYAAAVDLQERTAVYSAVDHGSLEHSRMRELETGRETTLPFAMSEQRFSPDGQWIAGESRDGEVMLCGRSSGRCKALTPKDPFGLISLTWSGDGTRLFFLRHTRDGLFGEVTSVGVHGGEMKTHGSIGPFQHRIHTYMGFSPHDKIVFARFSEGPQELWMAKLQ
jgi:Tol biopolymer transport system component